MSYEEDIVGGILSQSDFGFNDLTNITPSEPSQRRRGEGLRLDPQTYQYNRLHHEVNQAYARGMISHDEHADVMANLSGDNRNWFQKLLFDAPAKVANLFPGVDTIDKKGQFEKSEDAYEASGSVIETLFDVLSLPNYAAAAVSASSTDAILDSRTQIFSEDGKFKPAIFIGDKDSRFAFGVGVSPSAFWKSWQNREEYVAFSSKHDMFGDGPWGNFIGGVAMDIALDPLSYLTFGVTKGAQASATAATRSAAREGSKIASHAGVLTQTRFGQEIFKIAAARKVEQMQKAGKKTNGLLLDMSESSSLMNEITEMMISDFDSLAKDLYKRQREGWGNRISQAFAPSQANRSYLMQRTSLGHTVDDLFEETATKLHRDVVAYDRTKLRMRMAGRMGDRVQGITIPGLKYGHKFWGKALDTFATNWDAPQDLVEVARINENVARETYRQAVNKYTAVFGDMSLERRQEVSRLVENFSLWEAGEYTLGAAFKHDDDIVKAAKFVRREMDDILRIEDEAGYKIRSVTDYITHVYTDPRAREIAMEAVRRNGEESIDAIGGFTQHRLIATLGDAEDLFGEGAVLTDAFEILHRRKKASIAMIKNRTVNKYAIEQHSLPEFLISRVKEGGVSEGLIRGLIRRASYGNHKILTADQVFEEKAGNIVRLGFRQNDKEYNAKLLKYLAMPANEMEGGRWSEAGKRLAAELEANDAARMFARDAAIAEETIAGTSAQAERVITKPLSTEFKYRIPRVTKGVKKERPVPPVVPDGDVLFPLGKGAVGHAEDIIDPVVGSTVKESPIRMDFRHSVEGSGETIGFSVDVAMEMFRDYTHPGWVRVLRSGEKGTLNTQALSNWLEGFDTMLREELGVQLGGFIPDARNVVADVLDDHAARFKVTHFDADSVDEVFKQAYAPIENDLRVGSLPQFLVDFAHATRRAAGIIVDDAPIQRLTADRIAKFATNVGFDSESLERYGQAMFNKSLGDLTESEGDILLDSLLDLIDDPNMAGWVGHKRLGARYNGEIVERVFHFTRAVDGNPLAEIFDQFTGLPVAAGEVSPASSMGQILEEGADELGVIAGDGGRQLSSRVARTKGTVRARKHLEKAEAYLDEVETKMKELHDKRPPDIEDVLRREEVKRKITAFARAATIKKGETMFSDPKKMQELLPHVLKYLSPGQIPTPEEIAKMQAVIGGADEKSLVPLVKAARKRVRNMRIKAKEAGDPAKLKQHNAIRREIKALEKTRDEAVRLTRKARERYDEAVGFRDTVIGGGVEDAAGGIRDVATPSSEYQRLSKAYRDLKRELGWEPSATLKEMYRKAKAGDDGAAEAVRQLEQVQMPRALRDARSRMEMARAKYEGWVTRGSPIDEILSGKLAGHIEPDFGTQRVRVHLPRSAARVLDNYQSGTVDPAWSQTAVSWVRKFDALQTLFKTNLLLPWAGTWNRNAISNSAISYMASGLHIIDPKNGFENMRDFAALFSYVLAKTTDIPAVVAPGVKMDLDSLGQHTITLVTGETVKIADLAPQMSARGIFKGQMTTETLDLGESFLKNEKISRLIGGGVGGAAGALTGAVAGAAAGSAATDEGGAVGLATGALAGALGGAGAAKALGHSPKAGAIVGGVGAAVTGAQIGSEGETSMAGISYGSAMGLLAGAVIGARKPGGLPVPNVDRVTGLLQSRWAPMMRAGEAATETPFRTALFMMELKNTGSMRKAAQKVYTHLNDWNGMSVFERRYMRRMIPFYTWTKLAVQQTFETMVTNPGRLNNPMRLVQGFNTAHGYDPEDIPDFFHNRLVMISENEEGSLIATSGFGLPIEDVADMIQTVPTGLSDEELMHFRKGVLGRGPFGLVSGLEGLFNTDSFTGREIKSDAETSYFQRGDVWDGAPGWLKTLVGYKPATRSNRAVVNAHMAWLLGETPVSRFIETTKKIFELDEEGIARVDFNQEARVLLGANAYVVDPVTNKYYLNQKKIEAMAGVLSNVGAISHFDSYYDVDPYDADYSSSPTRRRRR